MPCPGGGASTTFQSTPIIRCSGSTKAACEGSASEKPCRFDTASGACGVIGAWLELKYTPTDPCAAAGNADACGKVTGASCRFAGGTCENLCWDSDSDLVPDTEEDRDGDGQWNWHDCRASRLTGVFVDYDSTKFSPVLEDATGTFLTAGAHLPATKTLTLGTSYPPGHHFVRVHIGSPQDQKPLCVRNSQGRCTNDATTVAKLRLNYLNPSSPPTSVAVCTPGQSLSGSCHLASYSQDSTRTYLLEQTLGGSRSSPMSLDPDGRFESIQEATFSPDGGRLAMAVVSQARPMLLATETLPLPGTPISTGLVSCGDGTCSSTETPSGCPGDCALTAAGGDKLSLAPEKLSGLSWTSQQRYFPAMWVGGYLHFQSKQLQYGFRGGLDELKIFAGLRDEDAFRSEAQRGKEFLARDDLDGAVSSMLPTCSSSHSLRSSSVRPLVLAAGRPGEAGFRLGPCP